MRQARFKRNRGIYKCQTFGTLQYVFSALIFLSSFSACGQEQPTYCLLYTPQYMSDPCPCYQFYLASTISDAPRAYISGGECLVTDIGRREGWDVASYPVTFQEGDQLISLLSPYYDDYLGCNECRRGEYSPSDGPVSESYDPR